MKTFRLLFGIAALVLLSALSARADNTRIVATIGVQMISEGDLIHKQAMQRCYEDSAATIEQCFLMLANEALDREVLRVAYALEPPSMALVNVSAWIDKNTRDPQKLQCIKQVFGPDTASYLHLFVSPVLVNPKLHLRYAKDTVLHKPHRDNRRIEMLEMSRCAYL